MSKTPETDRITSQVADETLRHAIHCIEIEGKHELECDVRYKYTPGDPGVRYYPDGSGCPLTPPKIEVLEVTVEAVHTWLWVAKSDPLYPCLVYPCMERDWLVDHGWAAMVDEIAFRVLDDMAAGDTDFYRKLVDEAECDGE